MQLFIHHLSSERIFTATLFSGQVRYTTARVRHDDCGVVNKDLLEGLRRPIVFEALIALPLMSKECID